MNCLKKCIILIVISCTISGCLHSVNLRQGIESFRKQDYRSAFIRLRPAAEHGQHDAEYAVGYMYYYGQGVVEDKRQAWFWISRAAAAGQPDAIAAADMIKKGRAKLIPIQEQ